MKASLKWLSSYVDIDVPVAELADKLIMNGLEVEGWESKTDSITGVVVGRIERLEKHPDADKLQICQINVGSEIKQIVTGAQNVFEGAYVPAALNGANLANGIKIKDSKLRGVDSFGMLCSGEELGLTEDDYKGAGVYGIMILEGEYELGINIWEAIGLDDTIIDFKVTANRADCNSIIGLAREVSVALGNPLRLPSVEFNATGAPTAETVKVDVHDTELCPRYMACAVRNVKIAESPAWMKERLMSAGVRAISNIVDITNYVMLETGQPMHAFDIRFLEGNTINVRRAADGEKIVTLDEKERELTSEMLVIADSVKPCAVAGIMGGENSGIKDDTQTIIFESAKFRRDSVRRTSRTLGLRSESSMRFEKGIDVVNVEYALKRALQLVVELGAGEIACDNIDVCSVELKERTLKVSSEKINALLGMDIDINEMKDILNKLFIPCEIDGEELICNIPAFREDIEGMADIAEEILRIYGYDRIRTEFSLRVESRSNDLDKNAYKNLIKSRLIAQGMYETATYSFINDKAFNMLMLGEDDQLRKAIRLMNPLGEDQSVMRTTLMHSLLNVVATNVSRKVSSGRIFEIGSVYLPKSLPLEELPDEVPHLILCTFGDNEDFYGLKSIVTDLLGYFGLNVKVTAGGGEMFHPYRKANILVRNRNIGQIGEIHPDVAEKYGIEKRVYVAELDITDIFVNANMKKQFKQLPKYPAMDRDIAVVVNEDVEIGPMLESIKSAAGAMLEKVELFDIFRGAQLGEGLKSVAFAMSFRVADRTLTDAEVNEAFNKILKRLESKYNARLR